MVDYPGELTFVPQLSIKSSDTLNLCANLLPTPVSEKVKATRHQIGKIHRRNGSVINNGLIRWIGRKL